MAKIYTDEEICYLRKNPNVRTIRHDRLSLTYEFRCHLYDAYMISGRSAGCVLLLNRLGSLARWSVPA